jgi:hypothetical protein
VGAVRVKLPDTKARLAPALVQPLQGRGKCTQLLCRQKEEGACILGCCKDPAMQQV